MSTFSLALGWWGSVVMLVVIGLSVCECQCGGSR